MVTPQTVPSAQLGPERIWRVRKRHDHIDAVIRAEGSLWEVTFFWNDRVLITMPFPDRAAADREVDARRRALHEAGWTVHW